MRWVDPISMTCGCALWRRWRAAATAGRYLPPYSPDFNPIEQVFSKIKGLLKQMNPRSFDAICDALKAILDKFKTREYANFIRHSGYVQT